MEADPAAIRERYERLLGRLRAATAAHGYEPVRLRIVGVTKGWPVEVARAATQAGMTSLGESRVQEAEPKVAELPEVDWHLVGRLQSNKARRAVRLFGTIHSVDSASLLERIDRIAGEEDRHPTLLLEVNVAGEASKAGLDPTELDAIRPPSHARLAGLMTIAPMHASDDEARRVFGRLRTLRDELADRIGLELPELSMGMSSDADAAAAEGATLVRIGTALFGPRG